MTSGNTICFACQRYRGWDLDHPKAHCEAFPEGIPDDILFGGFDHRNPHVGDHGIRFLLDPEEQDSLAAYIRIGDLVGAAKMAERWDPHAHPRIPKGMPHGGEFMSIGDLVDTPKGKGKVIDFVHSLKGTDVVVKHDSGVTSYLPVTDTKVLEKASGRAAKAPAKPKIPRRPTTKIMGWKEALEQGKAPLNPARIHAIDQETPPENAQQIEDKFKTLLPKARVVIRAPAGALGKILDDGRVKSQFETNASGGLLDNSMRSASERQMFGYPNDLPNKLRPIYGYMEEDPTHVEDPGGDASMYGDAKLVLKETVRQRTTFTVEDSMTGTFIDPPAINKVERSFELVRSPSLLTDPKWYADPSLGDYDQIPEWETVSPTGEDGSPAGYVETQIHGGVSLNDIDYIRVPPGSSAAMTLHKAGWTPGQPTGLDTSTTPWYPPGRTP